MGKITINELSNSLTDYMDEKQNVEDYSLMTESKTIAGAINEIYGKQLIADTIGEPLSSSDTFRAMSNDINELLNTFKTNMMNNGVTVESGDKFKQLIDKIATSKHIAQIETTAGGANTFIVKNDGSLWVSGYNNYGELGLGHEETVRTLTQVTTNINNDVKEVSCGGVTAMLVKNDGTLWACGKNAYSSLAIPDVSETATFIQVPGIDNVKHILCGYYFALAIKNDGSLWGCGSNGQGQLGLGDTRGRSTFTQVTTNINYDVKDFYCTNTNNENTVFIVKNDGSVWACGYNNYGSLGTGGTDNKNVFTQII